MIIKDIVSDENTHYHIQSCRQHAYIGPYIALALDPLLKGTTRSTGSQGRSTHSTAKHVHFAWTVLARWT